MLLIFQPFLCFISFSSQWLLGTTHLTCKLLPVTKMLRHSDKKKLGILTWSYFKSLLVRNLSAITLTSSSPPFKVVPPSFELNGLVFLATLIRGGGESQTQDHGMGGPCNTAS